MSSILSASQHPTSAESSGQHLHHTSSSSIQDPPPYQHHRVHGTHGEDEEWGDQHALHWDQVQGGQCDEAEPGQKQAKTCLVEVKTIKTAKNRKFGAD